MSRILIIEDNQSYNNLLKNIFKRKGYDVSVAFNGKEGLDLIQRAIEPFDSIILDLMMPVMCGKTFLEEYDLMRVLKKPPVCILSAKLDENILKDLRNTVITGYFRKGDDLENLVSEIEFSNIVNQKVEAVAGVYSLNELITKYTVLKDFNEKIVLSSNLDVAINSIIKIKIKEKITYLQIEENQPDGILNILTCKKLNIREVAA